MQAVQRIGCRCSTRVARHEPRAASAAQRFGGKRRRHEREAGGARGGGAHRGAGLQQVGEVK
jgi:hypothetical protein